MTDTENKNVIKFDLGMKRERIVDGMGELWDTDSAQKITYSHSIMCQTSMPFSNQHDNQRWEVRNGSSIMVIKAGEVYDPVTTDMVQLGLPYGTKPRLILLDWNRQAVLTQNPEIEVESSLYAFMKRLGLKPTGRPYAMVKKQLAALAACNMTIGRATETGGTTDYGKIVNHLDIWFPKDDKQRLLWPNTVTLAPDYFADLMIHAVPLDESALFLLRDSAVELDIYAMLAERLHRINSNKPQFVHWAGLRDQYGKGYKRIDNFRKKFRRHLLNVQAVYPDARLQEVHAKDGMPKGLLLCRSKPPVPPKAMVQNVKKLVEKPVD